jgi:hypothetical protein
MKLAAILSSAALAAIALAGCQPAPAPEPTPEAQPAPPVEVVALPCGIAGQRNWTAARARSGDRQTLTISGEIDLPTPGYGVSLERDPANTSTTTEPRLNLRVIPPSGVQTQVITPHPVYYFAPATGDYAIVHVMCDGQFVTEIGVAPPA